MIAAGALIEPHARVYLTGTDSIKREADLAAELIPGPAVLVGHSRGGLVATAIAERHPHLARELILLCPPWAHESRLSANRRLERALAIPEIGDVIWTAASHEQQRRAVGSAFARTHRSPTNSSLTYAPPGDAGRSRPLARSTPTSPTRRWRRACLRRAHRVAEPITTSLIGDERDPIEQETQAAPDVVAASRSGG